jgi:hypothetical protein
MKTYSFFLHYNKPASQKAGRNKLTVHWRGQCLLVDGIVCAVPIASHDRKTQPRCVLRGRAASINIVGDKSGDKKLAYIA